MRQSTIIYRGRDSNLPEVVVSSIREEERSAFEEGMPCEEPGAVVVVLDRYDSHIIVTTLAGEEESWTIVEKRIFMNNEDIDIDDASFLKGEKGM